MRLLRNIYRVFAERPILRAFLQTGVSLGLLAFLISMVQQQNLLAELQSLHPAAVLGAGLLYLCGYALNTRRWQLLLEHYQVHERYLGLLSLYFVGLFCSLFLPTGTGGDAVRAYEVARRSGHLVQTVVATLQERLLGLGSSMLIGLVATFTFFGILPEQLRIWALLIQCAGMLAVGLLIYPAPLILVAARFWRVGNTNGWAQRVLQLKIVGRITSALQPILSMPTLSWQRMFQVLAVTLSASLMGISAYYVLGLALNIQVGFLVYCLAVPMVWIIRMLPISLGGIGLGEGSFVFLIGLFGVPSAPALTLALAVLGVQTATTLIGGVLLLIRVARGNRINVRQPEA